MITEQRFSRFKDAIWFPGDESVEVLVGGAGGIGSWLTFLLSRAGVFPIVYDYDILEEHNLGGQLYPRESINLHKVDALQRLVESFSGPNIQGINEKYTTESPTSPYCFSGFDNMEARRIMFEKWVAEYGECDDAIFIDGRLTMEQLQIFCVTKDNIEGYRRHLFDDSQVADAPCTMKQTSHTAAMIASHMVGFFTNFLSNKKMGANITQVPFYWEYFIPLNLVTERNGNDIIGNNQQES